MGEVDFHRNHYFDVETIKRQEVEIKNLKAQNTELLTMINKIYEYQFQPDKLNDAINEMEEVLNV